MKRLLALPATAMLLLGCAAIPPIPTPTPTLTPPPVPAEPVSAIAPVPTQHEEDETWDCYTGGNLICGPTDPAQAMEAWDEFDPAVFTTDELAHPFRVTYRGTTNTPDGLGDGHEWYTVPSTTGGMEHVFEIEFGVSLP